MSDAGVFGDRRVELINGRIYRMPRQRTSHMAVISKAAAAILRVVATTDWLIVLGTYRIEEYSAPEPDFLWLPVPIGTPAALWPKPLLLIEVSDTTYRKDSGVKLRKYADHGIKDYWIVNIPADRVEVYRDPQNPTGKPTDCRYASVQRFARGQSVALLQRPQLSLAVDHLLP